MNTRQVNGWETDSWAIWNGAADRWTNDENFSNRWGGTDEQVTKIFERMNGWQKEIFERMRLNGLMGEENFWTDEVKQIKKFLNS